MKLSCTVFDIFSLIFQKLKKPRDNDHATFQRQSVVRRLGLAMSNMHTKCEVSSLSRSRDILEVYLEVYHCTNCSRKGYKLCYLIAYIVDCLSALLEVFV